MRKKRRPKLVRHGLSTQLAWAYLSCPVWYRHAESQWRERITPFAEDHGYTIQTWWVDHDARWIDAEAMLARMPGSGVRALFLPYPEALDHIPHLKGLTPSEIGELLNVRVFVLDGVMTIPPEGTPDLGVEQPRRHLAPCWRRRRAS